jgi:hypothetical protein
MYTIGHQAERGGYTSLRDVWMQNARTFWSKTKDLATGKAIIQGDTMEEFWALKAVSFGSLLQKYLSSTNVPIKYEACHPRMHLSGIWF